MPSSDKEINYFNKPEVKEELENFSNRIMSQYEQYKDTSLHAMYLWSIGEIDFKTQVDMIAAQLENDIRKERK